MINSESNFKLTKARQDEFSAYEPQFNEDGEELFVAGQFVPAGTYLDVDSFRQVTLHSPGRLPASFDGRRAFYRRYERPWLSFVQQPRAVERA